MAESISDQYAVIGNPIAHSQSPKIHALFAEQTEQDLTYSAVLAPKDDFPRTLAELMSQGFKGMNVTVPFKQDAFAAAHELSINAERAGAVNTLTIDPNGTIHADNTDGIGLVRDLIVNHEVDLAGKRILVLGAGGAVRGVLSPILHEQPELVHIANRTEAKADALVDVMSDIGYVASSGFDNIPKHAFDIVINGTAASLAGDMPEIPSVCAQKAECCYDMMYSVQPTVFQAWANELGVNKSLDGLGMLVEQAAYSFQLWRTVRPDSQAVYHYLREWLRQQKS